jgi:hypothetical protein
MMPVTNLVFTKFILNGRKFAVPVILTLALKSHFIFD